MIENDVNSSLTWIFRLVTAFGRFKPPTVNHSETPLAREPTLLKPIFAVFECPLFDLYADFGIDVPLISAKWQNRALVL